VSIHSSSGGFSADLAFINSVDELHSGNHISQLPEPSKPTANSRFAPSGRDDATAQAGRKVGVYPNLATDFQRTERAIIQAVDERSNALRIVPNPAFIW
jgi:hypothetical protein